MKFNKLDNYDLVLNVTSNDNAVEVKLQKYDKN